ncbi:YtkA-like [Oceanobacillus limi]|uniref:YtkA-like n=1 Tax=Oceanobacillus limi TaxID=930131 RepID=A0A1I0AI59_9BACI|nr:FixH family protein [Oceanobacillus limi]SES93901.1 YtkA-like [Oceanobacillus limi]
MNKTLIKLFLGTLLIITLAACTNNDSNADDQEEELATLDVELQVSEAIEVNEKLEMKAAVTYGDEPVPDAEEVEYEVWEEGQKDNSILIEATNHEDGSYTAETTFEKDGIFHVQVHVTAEGLHTMPKQEVTVGDGGNYPDAESGEDGENEHNHESDDNDDGDSHHHSEGFTMEFTELESVSINKQFPLEVNLTMDGEVLSAADVNFEIWSEENSDQHEWVSAEETKPGNYTTTYQFSEKGIYNIQIHVENEDGLHEHEQYEITVE